jgi:hypothetical protein
MARLVFVLANSGTGKTSSLRNLKKEEVTYVSILGKELPFASDLVPVVANSYDVVRKVITDSKKPMVVIDDANYLMTYDEMARANDKGFDKFIDMAKSFFEVIKLILTKQSDQTFYVMAHADEGVDFLRLKTTGKMLSEKVVLEGLTNIVIATDYVDGEFVFRVRTDGKGIKTPIGMFETETIPNDLKLVQEAIDKFYKKGAKK